MADTDLSISIKELRYRLRLKQAQMAELLGISRGALANYERGLSKPRPDVLRQIVKMGLSEVDSNVLSLLPPSHVPTMTGSIKVVGLIGAGIEDGQFDEYELNTIPPDLCGENNQALKVSGDSMMPQIQHGDIAIFDRTSMPKRGFIVAANHQRMGWVLKVADWTEGRWVLKNLNRDIEDPPLDAYFEVKGLLVGIVRDEGSKRIMISDHHGLRGSDL